MGGGWGGGGGGMTLIQLTGLCGVNMSLFFGEMVKSSATEKSRKFCHDNSTVFEVFCNVLKCFYSGFEEVLTLDENWRMIH